VKAGNPDLDISIETGLDDTIGSIELRPQEMTRAFVNIVNNAFDSVRKRLETASDGYIPTVTVSTARVGEQVEIRIADNGTGIPDEIRSRIFEPFFTTKPTGSGTGLGLSLSYEIVVEGHGGTLSGKSREQGGAEFVVTLPGKA